jgi:hypothetical protein
VDSWVTSGSLGCCPFAGQVGVNSAVRKRQLLSAGKPFRKVNIVRREATSVRLRFRVFAGRGTASGVDGLSQSLQNSESRTRSPEASP